MKTLAIENKKKGFNYEYGNTTTGNKIHFILNSADNRVNGFAGCNTFNGTYTLEEGHRIRFSNMATTMRACPDVDVNEAAFLKVFELTDNYTINGDRLLRIPKSMKYKN